MHIETRHIQLAAAGIVRQVITEQRNLNRLLEKISHEKTDWMPAQRAALQDLCYGTLRFFGQLQAILALSLHKPLSDERIRFLLLVALYQLQHGKSAHHAVVDHAVRAAKTLHSHADTLVNAVLRNFLRNQPALLKQSEQSPEGKYSYPLWWITELNTQYGEQAAAILEAGNRHPPMTLRVNQRRITTQDYLAQLSSQNISARLIEPEALQLDKPVAVDKLPGFFAGLVSVQDAAAQYAARSLDARDGMRVLDACAAPGGKTAHMLEHKQLEMVASDKDERRLQRVAENLQRLGLCAKLVVGDALEPDKWWDGKPFQRILADVPCSASGVVRRHPDIKWLRHRPDIAGFSAQQLAILLALWKLLAQDGKLLYATCSVFQQENAQVINAFLAQQPDASRLPLELPGSIDGQLLPDEQHDGFFYALLKKQRTECK